MIALAPLVCALKSVRSSHHSVEKNQRTLDSRQKHFVAWLGSIHMTIEDLDGRQLTTNNVVLACYTLHLCSGNTILCRAILSGTIMQYLSAAGQLYTSRGIRSPALDIRGRYASTITVILNECKRWETVKDRREPLTWDMVAYQ